MSKHNYSQYSNKNRNDQNKKNNTNNIEQPKPVMEAPVEKKTEVAKPVLVQETVETVTLPNVVTGTVAHCAKLNVREKPIVNSGIVCVLNVMSELKIDISKSTENWFYVYCATGAEGYCMKEYIDAHM